MVSAEIEKIERKLLALSQELLKLSGRDALMHTLELTGSSLTTMSKEDPTFAIQYANSFVQLVLGSVQKGLNEMAIDVFIKRTDSLSELSSNRKKELLTELTAALNIGQLVIAGKLLEANLGMPNLLFNALLAEKEESQALEIKKNSIQGNQAANNKMIADISENYVAKGFTREQADFLAQFAVRGIENATYLAPTQTKITSSSVNKDVLVNSIIASLLLSKKGAMPLNEASAAATHSAMEVMEERPVSTIEGFRKLLETKLQERGMQESSVKAAKDAIIIPAKMNLPPEAAALIGRLKEEIENQIKRLPVQDAVYAEAIKVFYAGAGQTNRSLKKFLSGLMQPAYWIANAVSIEMASQTIKTGQLIG